MIFISCDIDDEPEFDMQLEQAEDGEQRWRLTFSLGGDIQIQFESERLDDLRVFGEAIAEAARAMKEAGHE